MKKTIAVILCLLPILLPALASAREKLAVLDLDRSGVEAELAFSMSVVLRDELYAQGKFEVLSREDLVAIAKRLSLQQQAGDDCADDQCLVSYGRALGTRYMVAGVLSKVGSTYSVSLRLLDTEGNNAGVVNRVSERCKCSHDELFDTVAVAAAKLMGLEPTGPVQARTAPAPSVPGLEPEMTFVKGGCFQMGDSLGEGARDEKPVHEVCVDDFSIGRYEVTQGQWEKVMGQNPAHFPRGEDYPVETVSWNDAREYIGSLNRKSGKTYRLPTEAEWEYACRSGGRVEKYCGGDNPEELAWHKGNSRGATRLVGTKAPNGLGIYDMSGNVWEWVGDWYDQGYYSDSPKRNPPGSSSGTYRVRRGGSWRVSPQDVRSTVRETGVPNRLRSYNVGFRLVLPPIQDIADSRTLGANPLGR